MRLPSTLRPLLAGLALAGLTACSKEEAPLPATTARYELDGTLVTCRAVVYPLTSVYNGEQLLVRLFTTPTPASGQEYLDLSFVKQPTEPSSAYRMNWVRYNAAGLEPGGMLLKDAALTITEAPTGVFSGTASGTALNPNPTFSKITGVVFTNARL